MLMPYNSTLITMPIMMAICICLEIWKIWWNKSKVAVLARSNPTFSKIPNANDN